MLINNSSQDPTILNNPNKDGDEKMIEQTARVVSIKGSYAWVMPESATNCDTCSTKTNSCGKTKLFDFMKPKAEKLYAANPLHAKPGDVVVIGLQSKTLVLYSMLAYLMPLVSLMVFAMLGEALATQLGLPSEASAILAGLAGLLSGLRVAAWLVHQMSDNADSQPMILRHKEHHFPLHSLKGLA